MVTVIICAVLAAIVLLGIHSYQVGMASGCCGFDRETASPEIRSQERHLSH